MSGSEEEPSAAASHSTVKEYYGKRLQKSTDLKTSACCTAGSVKLPSRVLEALSLVHTNVTSKFVTIHNV